MNKPFLIPCLVLALISVLSTLLGLSSSEQEAFICFQIRFDFLDPHRLLRVDQRRLGATPRGRLRGRSPRFHQPGKKTNSSLNGLLGSGGGVEVVRATGSRNLEVPSSNPLGARAFFRMSTAEFSYQVPQERCIFAVFL